MNVMKANKWIIFCGYISLSTIVQNIISYYIVFDCYSNSPWSFFMVLFIIYCSAKLLWITVQSYYFLKSILEEFSLIVTICLILFGDIIPLIIFACSIIIDRHEDDANNNHSIHSNDPLQHQDKQCKESTFFLTSYAFISLPFHSMTICYLLFYPHSTHNNTSLYICCIINICVNMSSLIIISSNFWRGISRRISIYYAACCVLDVLKFVMTSYFVCTFIYDYQHQRDRNAILFYSSLIVSVKTFILSPLYAITLFFFEFVNDMSKFPYNLELATKIYDIYGERNPNCVNRICSILCIPFIVILYIVITLYLVFYLWIITDSVFFIYPICIFQCINDNLWINSRGFDLDSNKWRNVMRYMNNSINSFDYNLRLFLLNYSFFILKPNSYPKELLCEIQKGIKWYITDEIDLCQKERLPLFTKETRYNTITPPTQRTPEPPKHIDSTISIDNHHHSSSNRSRGRDWLTLLNLDIFKLKYNEDEDEAHNLYGLIATEYTHLLFRIAHDKLPLAHIYCVLEPPYNGFQWFLREGSPDIVGQKYVFIRERIFTYIVLPIHLLLNAYVSMINPLIVAIVAISIDNNMDIKYLFVIFYYVLLFVMLYGMISFISFLNIWYLCLYRKTEHYLIVDQYLCPLYEYVNTHKLKIDLILKVFGPLSLEMLSYLGYYEEEIAETEAEMAMEHKKYVTDRYLMSHYLNPFSTVRDLPQLEDRASDDSIVNYGGFEESKTKSYLDSMLYHHSLRLQHSVPQDALEKAPSTLITVLPEPHDIDAMLKQYGYYDNENKLIGYSGEDFKGYHKTVHKMQNGSSQKMIQECNFVLFPLDRGESNSMPRHKSQIEIDFIK